MEKKKILMIDDEVDLVHLVRMRLEFHDYAVIPLYTSKRAFEIVERENPDLILLDIMMPDIDGYSVCRKLKSSDSTKNIPIILFTAAKPELEKISKEYKKMGASDYIVKPFEAEALLEKVNKLIGQ